MLPAVPTPASLRNTLRTNPRTTLRTTLALVLLAAAPSLYSRAQEGAIRTIPYINQGPAGYPPRNGSWSPDSRLYTFVANDSLTRNGNQTLGNPGDILEIDAATGKASVLASVAQLSSLSSAQINEKDQDHRSRYSMSAFLWADDSRHLMLDNGGRLWLYDLAAAKGSLIVDTGAGSGDDPRFSPDARSVSYLRDHNLYVHPVSASPASAQAPAPEVALTANGSEALLNGEVDWVYLEEMEVRSNYFWSPDSSALAYLQADESKVPQYPITNWLPTHATIDEQRFPQAGDPNPAVRIGIVPATGGPTRWLAVPQSPGNDYIPRFGWVDAKTLYIEVLTRDHQHLNLYLADAPSGRVALVHSEDDPKYLDDNYDLAFLPPAPGKPLRFVNTSWRDGHTHLYLYQVDPQHPLDQPATLVKQLTQGDFDVRFVEPHGDSITYTSNEGNVLESNLWSVALDGSRRQRLTPASGSHDTSVSPDGLHFTDIASADDVPPTASLCATGGRCTPFWKSSPVPPATGVKTSRVSFLAADGRTTLYGLLTAPAGAARASVPVILNPYGGPLPFLELRNAWNSSPPFNELLAQHGFAVLTVENRGMGGRGRDFQQAAYRNFGPVQFSDQMAALDQALAKFPQLDPKRIGWWGWSWGGTFTLYAMSHTDRIRAGVAVAPNGDFRDYDTIYTERYLGLPAANPEVYKTASPDAFVAHLKGHLLLAQGTGDDNVHLSNLIHILEPLIEAGIPYDLQLFPGKTHSIAGLASRNQLFNRILAQFETYLK